jgi:glycosyltransferase involved in cell wall biosynthesis
MTMAGPDRADGSKQRAMEKARQLRVLNRIDFTNGVPKDRVGSLLDKGDIFLNTSSIDNTPVSVMEALSCGLCIVSTDVGGVPYLLEHGTDALLVEPGNPEVMARAILRILKEESLPERLSTNAISKAGRFDWSVTLPEWDRLLRSIQTS